MDMPVIAATRLERHIRKRNLLSRNAGKITVSREIAGVCRIRFSNGKDHFPLKCRFRILCGSVFRPYVFGKAECRPCFGPTRIESDMSDDFRYFDTGDSVFFRRLKMIRQRRVGQPLADERNDGHQTAVTQTEQVVSAPYLAEKNVVVELGKFRGERSQLFASCCLDYFFLSHTVEGKY